MDPITPLKRKVSTSSSSYSSLGSLLDEYNDEDLEKTNATLGYFKSSFSTKFKNSELTTFSGYFDCHNCALLCDPFFNHLYLGNKFTIWPPGEDDREKSFPISNKSVITIILSSYFGCSDHPIFQGFVVKLSVHFDL